MLGYVFNTVRRLNSKTAHSFPVRKASSMRFYEQALDCIMEVDFSNTESLLDFNTALMCLVVVASDGQKGTLSHLTIPNDAGAYKKNPVIFADRLASVWKKSVPVCIVGGETLISNDYLISLSINLEEKGFLLDRKRMRTGGVLFYRHVRLFADRVIVREYRYTGEDTSIELWFSS